MISPVFLVYLASESLHYHSEVWNTFVVHDAVINEFLKVNYDSIIVPRGERREDFPKNKESRTQETWRESSVCVYLLRAETEINSFARAANIFSNLNIKFVARIRNRYTYNVYTYR